MPTPMTSSANPDVLDRRFSKIFTKQWDELPTMLPDLYTIKKGRRGADERQSQFGSFANFSEFGGSVDYQAANQGYDVTATYKHYVSGFQVDVTYAEDDLFSVVETYPSEMALAGQRTRETHGSRMFNMAFSVDTDFYTHSEGVALCSNAHTTTAPNVSTASGFDNLTTSGLSLTNVIAIRILMRGFRNDQAGRINIEPDELWYPPDLCADAYEILESMGRPDNANNAKNYMFKKLKGYEWNYLSDANNYFMCDSSMRKNNVFWYDRIPKEFARAEDLDTIIMKWRVRMRYAFLYRDWRWVCGAQVS